MDRRTRAAPASPQSRSPGRRPGKTSARARARKGVLLYGASGYTGTLIARAAADHAFSLVVGGRDPQTLKALGDDLGCPFRVARLDDQRELEKALEGVAVVVNAAGPFSATATRLVEACLASRVHYLDISGEVDSFDALSRYDRAARQAGVMIMPGVGFDVVPSDCLALRVARRLPGAQRLRIAITGLDLISRGSARTAVEQVGRGVRVRRGGELVTLPEGLLEGWFDFGAGARPCTCVSWADVVSAFHTTGVPDIEVYFEATPSLRAFQLMGRSVGLFPPAAAFSRLWLGALMGVQPPGPSPAQRAGRRAVIVAQAENARGQRATSRAQVPEAYTFTAISASALAARVLAGEVEPGFRTPAGLFGAGLLEAFPEISFEDLD